MGNDPAQLVGEGVSRHSEAGAHGCGLSRERTYPIRTSGRYIAIPSKVPDGIAKLFVQFWQAKFHYIISLIYGTVRK